MALKPDNITKAMNPSHKCNIYLDRVWTIVSVFLFYILTFEIKHSTWDCFATFTKSRCWNRINILENMLKNTCGRTNESCLSMIQLSRCASTIIPFKQGGSPQYIRRNINIYAWLWYLCFNSHCIYGGRHTFTLAKNKHCGVSKKYLAPACMSNSSNIRQYPMLGPGILNESSWYTGRVKNRFIF